MLIRVEIAKPEILLSLLCCVLSNELFIQIILLLLVLWVRYHMKTKCAFKRYVKWALNTKLLLQNFLQICLRPK